MYNFQKTFLLLFDFFVRFFCSVFNFLLSIFRNLPGKLLFVFGTLCTVICLAFVVTQIYLGFFNHGQGGLVNLTFLKSVRFFKQSCMSVFNVSNCSFVLLKLYIMENGKVLKSFEISLM